VHGALFNLKCSLWIQDCTARRWPDLGTVFPRSVNIPWAFENLSGQVPDTPSLRSLECLACKKSTRLLRLGTGLPSLPLPCSPLFDTRIWEQRSKQVPRSPGNETVIYARIQFLSIYRRQATRHVSLGLERIQAAQCARAHDVR
jgi:hypothetical protein